MARKRAPAETEQQVLLKCVRRCPLCYGLNGDLTRKKGQIAHIDHDSSNSQEENLAYLCLEHHDEYDSPTSQAKGITGRELKEYKRRLLVAIESGDHLRTEADVSTEHARQPAIRKHDEKIFRAADGIMPEARLRDFLNGLRSEDAYYWSSMKRLDNFTLFFSETGNQFIQGDLVRPTRTLLEKLDLLLLFLAYNFFLYPDRPENTGENRRFCMHPSLNIDRGGSAEGMERYARFARELDEAAIGVDRAYQAYRLAVKNLLRI